VIRSERILGHARSTSAAVSTLRPRADGRGERRAVLALDGEKPLDDATGSAARAPRGAGGQALYDTADQIDPGRQSR